MKPEITNTFICLCIIFMCMVPGISNAQVTASFTASSKAGCAPLFVSFTNTSSGSGTLTYNWDFGNGNTSTLVSPSQTFNTCGNYVVTLTAKNGSSTSTDTMHITVYCKPIVTFNFSTSNGCPGTCINFTNTATAGCGTISGYLWDFGDGYTSTSANPTHCYNSSGNFSVSLLVTNSCGCSNSTVKTNAITIFSKPVASFTATPTSSCNAPATVTFTNASTGTGPLSYNWSFGDPGSGIANTSTLTNPTHKYNSTGIYSIRLVVTDGNGCKDTITIPNYINVGSLSAGITVFPATAGCCPFVVQFTATSTGTPSGYLWTFSGGISNSSSATPTVTFPCPVGTTQTTYTVTLTETFPGGCTATATTTISVDPNPKADFSSSSTLTTCKIPALVSFQNNSTVGTGASYFWSFGDGATSTATNPSHSYTACGTYNVMLVAINQYGCTDTITKTAFVNINCLISSFTATPNNGCVPTTVSFNSTGSSGSPTSWSWNFGDPGSGSKNTSTLQNPTHNYTKPGCYNVTLVTSNSMGCKDSMTVKDAVCVDNHPIPNFSANPTTTCDFKSINFKNSTTGTDSLTTYLWEFGDGTTSTSANPLHQYVDTGYFNVTLVACNAGCCDSITFVKYIHILPPIAKINVTINCANPYFICFDGSKSIGANTYSWNFGDPGSGALDTSSKVSPCHQYSTSGSYTVSLTVYNTVTGCSETKTTTVNARKVEAAFTIISKNSCTPDTVTFINNSVDASTYLWTATDSASGKVVVSSGQFSPTFTFYSAGVYIFELIVTDINGCTDTLISPQHLNTIGVTTGFVANPLSGCAPLMTQFTDNSFSSGGPIVGWSWNFGDPYCPPAKNSSTIKNPTHTYNKPGCYTITLTATDSSGCSKSKTRTNYVCVLTPGTNFTASDTNACVGANICFTSSVIGTGYTYSWNFGDPGSGAKNTSILPNPCHTYNSTGLYTVTLKVTTSGGCDSTLIKTSYIKISKPTAKFGVNGSTSTLCPPFLVNFVDSSFSNITSWNWNFGDGNTSTAQNPSHIYNFAGTYTVTLIVTNSAGCSDTLIKKNYIVVQGPSGTFTFAPGSGCAPLNVCFVATASSNLTFIWNYGNTTSGALVGADSICYTYTVPGIYHPSLVLENTSGCIFSVISPDSVVVDGARAKFKATVPTCGPGIVSFTDSTFTLSTITSWGWNFGDPGSGALNTSTIKNPTHNYTSAGTYIVTLTIKTKDGCTDNFSDTLTIGVPPKALMSILNNPVCIGGTISFKDSTQTSVSSWSWNYGDPGSGILNTSNKQNGSHQYKSSGTFTVKLVVTDQNGCKDSITKTVIVNPLPVVTVSPTQSICANSSVIITATGGVNYLWTPSSGLSSSTISNPTANPTSTTTYIVLVTDKNGCQNKDSLIVKVNPLPAITVSPGVSICTGSSSIITASGGVSYQWTPATGLSNNTVSNPTASPTATTTYTVSVTDANGCKNKDSVVVKVNPLPVISITPVSPICTGTSATLTAIGAVSYTWTPAKGLSATSGSSVTANPTTSTTYTISGTDGNGCAGTSTVTVTVNPNPVITTSPPASICSGASTTLTAGGAATYAWTPATGLSNTTGSTVTANPTATTAYTITGTDANGCSGTTAVSVPVNPNPLITVNTPPSLCAGTGTTLTASGGVSYSWTPSTGLNSSTGSSVVATPGITTTYTITGADINGCTGTTTVTLIVNPLPIVKVTSASSSICNGSSTVLTASGAKSYTWSPSAGLSTTSGSSVIANPTVATTYTVNAIDSNGCAGSATATVSINPFLIVTVTPNTPSICSGGSTVLTATGANSYSWTPATGISATSGSSVTANPTSTITYSITGTDSNGCTGTTTATVTVNPNPTINVGTPPALCSGTITNLTAGGGSTYTWSPSTGLSATSGSSVTASPSTTTTYAITGTDVNGCTNTTMVTVTVNISPVISIVGPSSICSGTNATLTASGGSTYTWSPSTGLNTTTGSTVVSTLTTTTTYTVIGTDSNGCTGTASITIDVAGSLVITTNSPAPFCSGGSATLIASGGSTYTWSPPSGLNATTGDTVIANPIISTTYTVTGTDINGCTGTSKVTVTVNPNPVISTNTPPSICIGSSVKLIAGGGSTYSWTPSAGLNATTGDTVIANPGATTTYTLTGTDVNGCSGTTTVVVIVNPNPNILITGPTSICSGNSATLTATGGSTYTWTPASGLSATTGSNVTSTITTTTTYTVTGTDLNGCTGTSSITITVAGSLVITTNNPSPLCIGNSSTIIATGGLTYTWTPSSGLNTTTGDTVNANPGTTTTYTVTGTDINGCTGTITVTITVNPNPIITVNTPPAICMGSGTTLIANGGSTYSWIPFTGLNSTTGDTVNANPSATTTYTVTGTNINGCSGATTTVVTVNPNPNISITGPTSICNGNGATLNASGGSIYAWSPSTGLNTTTGSSVVAAPSITTTYTVTGTDANGCTGTSTITITVAGNLTITTNNPSPICIGSNTTLIANGGLTYTWSPATGLNTTTGDTIVASPGITTTYTVTGTDVNGCTGTTAVVVIVNPNPAITTNLPPSICNGLSTTLIASGGNTYSWTPATGLNSTTGDSTIANPVTTTTYTITGTDINGCTATTTVVVVVNPNLAISLIGPSSICSGTTATLVASGALTYAWTPSTGLNTTTGDTVIAKPGSTTTYTVTGTDLNGCTGTATINITVAPNLVITTNTPSPICAGNSTTLMAAGGLTYTWTPSSGLNATTGDTVIANPITTTTYTVTVTDINGCTGVATVIVTINPNPVIATNTPPAICSGSSATLITNGGSTYIWSPATGLNATTGGTVLANPGLTTTYTVTGTDINGCVGTATVTVAVNPNPIISVTGPTSICNGNSATLIASGGATYTWTPSKGLNTTTGDTVIAKPGSTTTYTVTGTDLNGCTGTSTITITVAPNLVITTNSPSPVCSGNSATLIAAGGLTYSWIPSTGLNVTTGDTVIANPGTTTTYTVTGTDINGCSGTTTVVVAVNPNPVLSVNTPLPICNGSSTTLVAGGATTYSWNPSTGLNSTIGDTVIANPSITTTYSVSGTDINGCVGTTSVTVTVNPNPVITATGPPSICIGYSAALIASGGVTYAWTPATGLNATSGDTVIANPGTTTYYTVVGTDANGCFGTSSIGLIINPNPVISATGPPSICSGNSATLTATGGISYTWLPAKGLNSTTGAIVVSTILTATTYTVTGIDINGCSGTSTIAVGVNPTLTVLVNNPSPICLGGSATLTASGGSTYIWTPVTGLNTTSGDTVIANSAASTIYTVIGTDINGCTGSATVAVTVNPKPVITVSQPAPICNGGSAILTANGGSTYTWAPSIGLSSTTGSAVTANPSTSVTYIITGVDVNGCAGTASTTLTVNPLPVISVSAPPPICNGSSVVLTATGGVAYLWSPSTGLNATSGSSVTANPGTTTTYMITGTDINGCTGTNSVIVTVNPNPVIIVPQPAAICNGNAATLTVNGAATYMWTPSTGLSSTTGSSVMAKPSTSTTYTVTGIDNNGCSGTANVTVTVNPSPLISTSPPPSICDGSSTTLTVSGASLYTWWPAIGLSSTTGPSITANPTVSTTYTVTGTDINGCVGSATVAVTVNPAPVITVTQPLPICFGATAILTSTGASTYSWNPSTGLSATTGASITASPGVSTIYTVTGTDKNGCKDSAVASVIVNPNPVITVTPSSPICIGSSTALTAAGGNSYVWTPSAGLSATSGSSITASPVTTSTYFVTGTDTNGCKGKDSVLVKVNPLPAANAGPDHNICLGASVTIIATGGSSYSWGSDPAGFSSSSPTINVSPAITTEYTVAVTDTNGCKGIDSTTVIVHPLPNIVISKGTTICLGSSTQLNASGGTIYSWTPSSTLNNAGISNPIATPIDTTFYIVSVTDSFGCKGMDSVEIDVRQRFKGSVGQNDTICTGNSVQLNATGGATYRWSPPTGLSNPNISNPIASPTVTTTYQVIISDSICFNDTATVVVAVIPLPVFEAGQNRTILAGESVVLGQVFPVMSGTFSWTPPNNISCTNCQNPTVKPDSTTIYMATFTDLYGCRTSDSVIITVICPEDVVFVPDAFTPNGDGLNDVFYVRSNGLRELIRFRIFDRWGQEMFETNDLNTGWDGTFKGQKLPPAVYVWDVDAICSTGIPIHIKGNVTLIR